jgi:HK97 family phage major capsid protein
MNFKYKTSQELEALTNVELDQYKADLKAHETDLQKSVITEEVKTQLEKAKEDLGKEISAQLAEMKNKSKEQPKTFYEALKEAIDKNRDALLALKDNPNGNVKLEVNKAVVDMTFATNSTGRVGRSEIDPTMYGKVYRPRTISEIISITPTNARHFTFINKTGYEGAPAMTAEGVIKPVGDWNLVETVVNPKKVAFIVTVSKEMLDDIDNMASDVMMDIQDQILDVMENQWLNGDGTADNISGIVDNATPYAAGPFALAVDFANNKDVLRTAIDQVRRNNFYPNYIVISTSDAAAMDLEKEETSGQYLLPPFVGSDGLTIKGIPVIESNYVAAGKFFVGDFTKYKGKVREGLTIDTGYKTGDWEKNFTSFRGEARFFGYIPTNHYGAIVYGDFTAAKAALETA